MVNSEDFVTEYEDRNAYLNAIKNNNNLLIVKFGSTWCRPCKKCNPLVLDHLSRLPSEVTCATIDIDDSFDVFAYLKSKKMVKGVPVILCYKKENDTFIPDDSVSGADDNDINAFFERCKTYL
jgi:thioredoxin-like negative regulator of GroEL